ncbi:MAG: hypothetical protein ABSF95_17820 [Verrucomicrobiota bacterium]|jgi:hypothetical protein
MKIPLCAKTPASRPSGRRERGSAVIVVLALLAIVFIYIGYNVRTLHYLARELKLVERQQTRRLQAGGQKAEAGGQRPEPGGRPGVEAPKP